MKRRWIKGGLFTCIVLGICTFGAAREKGGKPRLARETRPSESPAARTNNRQAQPTTPASAAGSLFDGKLVAITLRGATQPKLLDHARFEEIHGRTFVVGKEAKATFSFPLGDETHVAWDAVEAFNLFDNVEQYESAVRKALEGVQGAVNGVIGEFFPGARISGVNIGPTNAYRSESFPQPVPSPYNEPQTDDAQFDPYRPSADEPVFDPIERTYAPANSLRPVPDYQEFQTLQTDPRPFRAPRPEMVRCEVSYIDAQGVERRETRLMRRERIQRVVIDDDGQERMVLEERLVESTPAAAGEATAIPRARAPTKGSTRRTSPSASPR